MKKKRKGKATPRHEIQWINLDDFKADLPELNLDDLPEIDLSSLPEINLDDLPALDMDELDRAYQKLMGSLE